MVMGDSRDEPFHRISLPSRVFCTEFSPFEWSAKWGPRTYNLDLNENHIVLSPVFWLLDFNPRWRWGQYGCLRKVTPTSSSLRSCKRFTTTPGTWWTLGTSFSLILSRVQAIAWSPATSLVVAPKTLQFATSGTDHKLRLFSSDLNEVKVSEKQKP